ncbi:MAG: AMP-binding protein, partial [Clostridia bacterium]|nr:AMP-binding protein [Clostridia bacterium]
MAEKTDVSKEEYIRCENGDSDLNFAFIYRCAQAFNVDVTDIIEGRSPKLRSYTLTRKGEGQRIEKAHGMTYYSLASKFSNRISEPLYVVSKYNEDDLDKPIELTTHIGQECDIVVEGSLKVQVGEHTEILNPGDSIYYNSSTPHGMRAVGGKDCIFYAMVLNPIKDASKLNKAEIIGAEPVSIKKGNDGVYKKFVETVEDENGTPISIKFHNEDKFNFAFDIVDELAKCNPNKLAMLHISSSKEERRFTFEDMSKLSNRAANYFKSVGIKKGDKVMLVLGRHYQFWYAMLGLNKIGAIAIPAMSQLLEHDFEYRFNAAQVSAIICMEEGIIAEQAEKAMAKCPQVKHKFIVGGSREGWRNFDEEFALYSTRFERTKDSPCGDDIMLMFFTSGTTGYPKIAAHNFKYALGHFHTAKYWHNVNSDGLHFTISDTGWAKAMWGKLYGQWLCEAATFVYDFEKFKAEDILPLFAKYHITTFCAPPTMLRMLIKEDISKYDLSSVEH